MEEESWMRKHRGRIWEASRAIWTPRRHPGGTQEAPRRHPEAPRAPRGTQEAPRRSEASESHKCSFLVRER